MLTDGGHVLDYAHDDECSFKLTSAEARRSADDSIARRMRDASERETQEKKKKKPRREYHHHRAAATRPPARGPPPLCHATLLASLRRSCTLSFRGAIQTPYLDFVRRPGWRAAQGAGFQVRAACFPPERFARRRGPLRDDFRSSPGSRSWFAAHRTIFSTLYISSQVNDCPTYLPRRTLSSEYEGMATARFWEA